jgi:hypothetical protein
MDIPLNSVESLRATPHIRPIGDIIQHLRMRIQHRIHEPDWTLADREALLVDLQSVSFTFAYIEDEGG